MIDSHAHLDFPEFDVDRDAVFESMKNIGIEKVIIPGVSHSHWDKQLQVASQYCCPYALGIHPWFCDEGCSLTLSKLDKLVGDKHHDSDFIAIGECGLDKHHHSDWHTQVHVLKHQLMLAKTLNLPVILHVVKAHNEMIILLKHYKLARGGVIHGFSGSVELANEYIKLGYKLGIGGLILNHEARKLRACVTHIGLESILIETDSPAMVPNNSLEKRNTPLVLPAIIDEIAKLQKKSSVLISEQVRLNVIQMFDF
ncbi:TatD family hydrolase [Shewanella sp. VB17]|uniref:TatD family hydrolase n=1 Tax=Shewanella sp. VB17 TaxID=2739432 RepID=UPI001567A7E7|nr:TatD family hydrolase [Shewanella sp. VB17]NRD72779.1 TatD family hydrolase [Shewanella sp. VB17]